MRRRGWGIDTPVETLTFAHKGCPMHVQRSRTRSRAVAVAGTICLALITASCSSTGIFPWSTDVDRGTVMENQPGSRIPLPPSVHDFDRNQQDDVPQSPERR